MSKRYGQIVQATHNGDTLIAEFQPGVDSADNRAAIVVAQKALTDFLNDCIERHGKTPPVFARRIGDADMKPFHLEGFPIHKPSMKGVKPLKLGEDRILDVETILIQQPLVGG